MVAALLLVSLACFNVVRAAKKNVVFIVIDDLGFDDVGFRSHQINTPTIDALAKEGLVLENYYVQDVCSPSRATFMTGRYAMHHTIVDWIPPASAYGLPLNETTMAEKFAEAGYACHATGKWHLGFYKWEMTPTFRGFESFRGFYTGGEQYFSHQAGEGAYDFRLDNKPNCGANCSQVDSDSNGKYSTTVFTTEAVRVINEHPFESKPLFLYLAYQGVHSPAEVPQSYIDPYNSTILDPKRRTFAGMLSAVDEGIGNVTTALRARGVYKDTIFVFTADNGGPTTTGDGVGARNWPLKGGKHSIWEGGVRATAFISGADALGVDSPPGYGKRSLQDDAPHGSGMRLFRGLMHGADWLPTLASVAGFDLNGTLPLDGVDQWGALRAAAQGDHESSKQLGRGVNHSMVVLGNSTNVCSWKVGDPRYHVSPELLEAVSRGADVPNGAALASALGVEGAQALGCGFAIRVDDGDKRWKLIKGYGGGPDTWCNTSRLPGGNVCGHPNETAISSQPMREAKCALHVGLCFGDGPNVAHAPVHNATDCCSACNANPECTAFTFNSRDSPPTCWLKSWPGPDHHKSTACISGTNGRTPAPSPPSPSPTRCPNGWCLFELSHDPSELHEVSASNQEVVNRLQKQMATVLLSYKQYQEDPACQGKTTFAHDSVVGKAWQPWC